MKEGNPQLEWLILHDPAIGWREFKPPDWEQFRALPPPMWGTWKKLWMANVIA